MDCRCDRRALALWCSAFACGPVLPVSDASTTDDAHTTALGEHGGDAPVSGGGLDGTFETGEASAASNADSSPMDSGETTGGIEPMCPGDPLQPDPAAPACMPDRVGTWSPMSEDGSPSSGWGFTMVWTGDAALVWGGFEGSAAYHPDDDVWTPITSQGAPSWRMRHSAVWTGSEMILWGGSDPPGTTDQVYGDGGRYRPDLDSWMPMTDLGAPASRYGHVAVWTGEEMIVFGGTAGADGARYDPVADVWQPMAPADFAFGGNTALWSGSEVIFWGGTSQLGEPLRGGRYDPVADTWQPMTMVGAPSFVDQATAVWTGSAALYHGGCCVIDGARRNRAAAYDPVADAWGPDVELCGDWATISVAVWTGCDLLVWLAWDVEGGAPPHVFRFDGDTTWQSDAASYPERRTDAQAVWTGEEMIVFGGNAGAELASVGGVYRP